MQTRLLLGMMAGSLLSWACKSPPQGDQAPVAASAAAGAGAEVAPWQVTTDKAAPMPGMPAAEEEHGANWQDTDADAPTTKGWKEAGVYVDGKPIGILTLDELPSRLKPVMIEQTEYLDFKPGDKGPRERTYKTPHYRVADYLEAVGIDLATVKAVHLYGGGSWVAGISGDDFRKYRKELMFDFAREGVAGHLRPYFPDEMPTNTTFDRLIGIVVYIEKTPPIVNEHDVAELDGVRVDGVPYFGAPLRGGVRIYLDDRLVTVIKRNTLAADGRQAWSRRNLFEFLAKQGVDTSAVSVAELRYRGEQVQRIGGAEVKGLFFIANEKASGEILVGEGAQAVSVVKLYSKGKAPAVTKANR